MSREKVFDQHVTNLIRAAAVIKLDQLKSLLTSEVKSELGVGVERPMKGYGALPYERRCEVARKAAKTRKRRAAAAARKAARVPEKPENLFQAESQDNSRATDLAEHATDRVEQFVIAHGANGGVSTPLVAGGTKLALDRAYEACRQVVRSRGTIEYRNKLWVPTALGLGHPRREHTNGAPHPAASSFGRESKTSV